MADVVLRDVVAADLPTLYAQQQDPEANAMAAFPARDHDAFIAHWVKILADDALIKRTIVVDGDIAGNIVAFEHDGKTEVGYWLGRSFWGRGIATAALKAFLDIVAHRPLYAGVVAHNVASIRVLEKCGFVPAEERPSTDDEVLLVLGPK
ncbi:MAG: GNAT family N-acetyltransferase [Actinomycetota bacterium]